MKTLSELKGATVDHVVDGDQIIIVVAGLKIFVDKIEPVENTVLDVKTIRHAFKSQGV